METMRDIPIRMIAYGASEHNISLLVDTKHKNEALNALNEGLFKFDWFNQPQNETAMAMKKIKSMVNAYNIEAISIGNGTASRETEFFIKKIAFDKPVQVFVVSEAGASVYSASKIAREEFPNYDVTVRGSVSILSLIHI